MDNNNIMDDLVAKQVFLDNPKGLYAITIDNVFSEEECKEWIELTEKKGYELAMVNVGGGMQVVNTNFRNNDRCIIDNEEMANKIYERVSKFIPTEFMSYQKVSLNERLRFLRYHPNQQFKTHMDGSYERESGAKKGEISYITLQLYLNSVEQGGETTFKDQKVSVNPKPGTVLLFQHNIWHKGSVVNKGVKYVVRTDVMYKPL